MRAAIVALGLGAVVAAPAVARADASPPEEMACLVGRAGSPCAVDGHSGVCTHSTCTHRDYLHPDDAGQPGTITVPCLLCVAGAADGGGPDASAPADVATGSDESGLGCGSVTNRSGAELSALAVAGSFSLLMLVRRRRNRR